MTSQHPAPETVLAQWQKAGEPKAMIYKDLNLVVKVGYSRLRVEEVSAMQLIEQSLPHDKVPVPQVYGWHVLGQHSLLYMSLAPGLTLMDAWPTLNDDEKHTICSQLGSIVVALRSIKQPAALPRISAANGGPVRDRFLQWTEQSGGYVSVSQFHDFVSEVALPAATLPADFKDPWRGFLPDDSRVYFTHGDLTLTNIMVAGVQGSRRISSIIDWEQAGWYPEYWEYCKLHIGVDDRHEWRAAGWADRVMQNYEDEFYAIAEYWQCRPP